MIEKSLREEVARYKKVLEFYADKQNYKRELGVDGLPYLDIPTQTQRDGGKLAREILEAE